MYGAEREDELLMKLQKCIGKIQPKSYEIGKRKQSSFCYTANRKKQYDQENISKPDQSYPRYQSIRRKQPDYQKKQIYADRKHELRVEDWKGRRNNENYLKQMGQTLPNRSKKNDPCVSGQKKIEYEHREVLGNMNSALNTHRNSLSNHTEVLRPTKPSYENYKVNKNIEKQISFQSPRGSNEELQSHKWNENQLRRNYPNQEYQYDKNETYLPLQRSRFEERVEKKQVKKQPSNEDAAYGLDNSCRRYDRKTFSAAGQLRQNRESSRANLKNVGGISTQNRLKDCCDSINRSLEKGLGSPRKNQSFDRSRIMERSRRMQNLGEERSVRRELEEVAMGKNQDTFYKLRKIGELNERINTRIKKIIETFEYTQH